MTPSPAPHSTPVSDPRIPAPVCMLYTLLRHGRGLSHEEATRRIDEAIGQNSSQAA